MSRGPDDRFSDEPLREGGRARDPDGRDADGRDADGIRERPSWERADAPPDIRAGGGGGSLGSLAQSARSKELNTARSCLIAVGVITIVANLIQLLTLQSQIDEHLRKGGLVIIDRAAFDRTLMLIRLVLIGFMALGGVFIVLGALVKSFPVPMTITGLVLYIVASVVGFVIDPESIKQMGIWVFIKIAIVVALAKAVQAAFAYEKEKREEQLGMRYE
ncbi:MAG: hypothetical protein U0793_29420 [Gemmataceae bacterium]